VNSVEFFDIAKNGSSALTRTVDLKQTAKKIEQEESSENNAFGSSFSGNPYPIGGGGHDEEAGALATPCR